MHLLLCLIFLCFLFSILAVDSASDEEAADSFWSLIELFLFSDMLESFSIRYRKLSSFDRRFDGRCGSLMPPVSSTSDVWLQSFSASFGPRMVVMFSVFWQRAGAREGVIHLVN